MHWLQRAHKKFNVAWAPAQRFLFQIAVIFMLGQGPSYAQTHNDYLDSFDGNGDKRVSLIEFQKAMSWAFEQMDKNGDGVLSPEEQLIPKAKTFTLKEHHDRLAIQFSKQDRNHDGFLSAKELAAPPQM
jgi:Ca2+-binding EF-hand superfamily protein